MTREELLNQLHTVASNPAAQLKKYLDAGEKVVAVAPVYTPEEVIHAMGFVPMGVWGADVELSASKEYFPAFICSVLQSILEMGMKGTYNGVSAIVVPSLCDSLKCLGENWKYAVPSIPFIPMVYPQNRANQNGVDFAVAGYRRVAADLEKATGAKLTDEALSRSIRIYNEHNKAMRAISAELARHPEITAAQRSDIFKSAWFMRKEEHTALVNELLKVLAAEPAGEKKIDIVTSGILCDSPALLEVFDRLGFHIVADDIAAESRQYRVDCAEEGDPIVALGWKFANMGNCSVLYDVNKGRADHIVKIAKEKGARGVVMVMTKFCDPEEFDYVIIKKACDEADLPVIQIEVDRQMQEMGQIATALETYRDLLENR